MPSKYVATDKQSGLEVEITGEFPPTPEDRIHLARTANLFTQLLAAGLATTDDTLRRELFTHLESQLELAAALIKQDFAEVTRLMQAMLGRMGITPEKMEEMAKELGDQLKSQLGDQFENPFAAKPDQQPEEQPGTQANEQFGTPENNPDDNANFGKS